MCTRKQAKLPIIEKHPPKEHPEAEFVMSLSAGETLLAKRDNVVQLFRFATVIATTREIRMLTHNDARDSKGRKLFTANPGSFAKNFPEAQKVEILPNGEKRRC